MDTPLNKTYIAIQEYDIDTIKIMSPRLSSYERHRCIAHIFESADNGELDFEMYQNLMTDTNDINYSSVDFGLPLNCVIVRGKFKIAKEMITKWSAHIFTISNNSQFSPMETLLRHSKVSEDCYDLLHYMLLQYYRRNSNLTVEMLFTQLEPIGALYSVQDYCNKQLIKFKLIDAIYIVGYFTGIPRDIVGEIIKFI